MRFDGRVSLALIALVLALAPARAETPRERGTYLMSTIVACATFTTLQGAERPAPSPRRNSPAATNSTRRSFHAVVPNITPDMDTGIGNWTDDQIINAIRNGKRPDGRIIGPPMPIAFYRGMADSDVRAIVAYLRTVKPIHNEVDKSSYSIPLPVAYGPVVTHVADVPRTDKVAYGRYIATGLGHCMDCHTPLDHGRSDMARLGAGGNQFESPIGGMIISANLTPANPAGIAGWTDAQLKTAIRDGQRPDRPLVRLMAFDWYKGMADDDLDALVAFLRTLKPVKTE